MKFGSRKADGTSFTRNCRRLEAATARTRPDFPFIEEEQRELKVRKSFDGDVVFAQCDTIYLVKYLPSRADGRLLYLGFPLGAPAPHAITQ